MVSPLVVYVCGVVVIVDITKAGSFVSVKCIHVIKLCYTKLIIFISETKTLEYGYGIWIDTSQMFVSK